MLQHGRALSLPALLFFAFVPLFALRDFLCLALVAMLWFFLLALLALRCLDLLCLLRPAVPGGCFVFRGRVRAQTQRSRVLEVPRCAGKVRILL